jgi:N-acetylneuraminate synthase
MDPQACSELIKGSRIIAVERGGKKGPTEEERPTINFAFATVVTIAPIRAGEVYTKDNIWVKRPGTGELKADRYEDILGKLAVRDLAADTHLAMLDVNW